MMQVSGFGVRRAPASVVFGRSFGAASKGRPRDRKQFKVNNQGASARLSGILAFDQSLAA
jgi:hypothetical protein